MRESDVERFLVKRIKSLGFLAEIRKVSWPGRRGAPDRVVFLADGSVIWVELKAPNGRLSASQKREHQRLRDMGQQVDVLWSIDQVDRAFPL